MLSQEAALVGVIGPHFVSEPGGHSFAGSIVVFGDVDAVLTDWASGVLAYDEANDVGEEDEAFCKRC